MTDWKLTETFAFAVQALYTGISKPLMILWGSEDTWIPVERGRLLHELIPGSLFHEIPNAGHLVIEEQPALLVEKIGAFLANETKQ